MADPEVATKALETDLQEDVAVTPDEQAPPAEAKPAMCDDCTSDRPTPAGESARGEMTKFDDIDVYISKPADYPHTSAKLLLLLTNGTGLKSINNQIQADRFASEGFVVVMPDLFEGDAAPNSGSAIEESSGSYLDTFRVKAAETAKMLMIDMWLARHTEEKVMPILKKVLDVAKDEFADAVSNGGGVYSVGYCFGGRYILLLASQRQVDQGGGILPWTASVKPEDAEASKPTTAGPYIKAGALAHATMVSPDDFEGLRSPISVVCVENDPMFPDEVRKAGEDYMSRNNVEHEVQVYPGVPHGFAVVGEYADSAIRSAQATAFDQILRWLKEH